MKCGCKRLLKWYETTFSALLLSLILGTILKTILTGKTWLAFAYGLLITISISAVFFSYLFHLTKLENNCCIGHDEEEYW